MIGHAFGNIIGIQPLTFFSMSKKISLFKNKIFFQLKNIQVINHHLSGQNSILWLNFSNLNISSFMNNILLINKK
jgi:hypothetical protein